MRIASMARLWLLTVDIAARIRGRQTQQCGRRGRKLRIGSM